MTKIPLYPYPRLPKAVLDWEAPSVTVDSTPVHLSEIADEWDANSLLELSISIKVKDGALERLGGGDARLAFSLSCPSTALARDALVPLSLQSPSASASIEVRGWEIAEEIVLRAALEFESHEGGALSQPWLARRIVGEAKPVRIVLRSDLEVFPTAARSFKKRNWLETPWQIRSVATDLTDPFASSIRLYLNEDLAPVRALIDAKPSRGLEAELDAAITRVLLLTARNLMDALAHDVNVDAIAQEYPDSLAAAARRVAVDRLNVTLSVALEEMRTQPGRFEQRIAAASGVGRATR